MARIHYSSGVSASGRTPEKSSKKQFKVSRKCLRRFLVPGLRRKRGTDLLRSRWKSMNELR
jgi:hypothetical protein